MRGPGGRPLIGLGPCPLMDVRALAAASTCRAYASAATRMCDFRTGTPVPWFLSDAIGAKGTTERLVSRRGCAASLPARCRAPDPEDGLQLAGAGSAAAVWGAAA